MDKPNAQAKSPSYLLPVEDTQFLLRDEMRATGSLSNTPRPSCCCATGAFARPSSCSAAPASPRPSRRRPPQRRRHAAEQSRTAAAAGGVLSPRANSAASPRTGRCIRPQHRWRQRDCTGGGPASWSCQPAPSMPARRASVSTSHCPTSRIPTTSPRSSASASTTSPCARCTWRCATRWRSSRRFRHDGRIVRAPHLQQTHKAPPAPVVCSARAYWRRVSTSTRYRGHDCARGPEAVRVRGDGGSGLGLPDPARPARAFSEVSDRGSDPTVERSGSSSRYRRSV